MSSSASLCSSFLTELCGSFVVCAMLLIVLFSFLITPSKVMLISFFSALSRRSFSIEDSICCFSFYFLEHLMRKRRGSSRKHFVL